MQLRGVLAEEDLVPGRLTQAVHDRNPLFEGFQCLTCFLGHRRRFDGGRPCQQNLPFPEPACDLLNTTVKVLIQVLGNPADIFTPVFDDFQAAYQVMRDEEPEIQYKRAAGALGIPGICADSPPAKGRVARMFETLQDR